MSIGLIGVGHQGRKFIETCKRMGVELAWAYSRPRFDADAIIIATPAETHYSIAKEAILEGKDVLIEKPMTMDPDEAEDLLDLAYTNGVTGFVDHTHLYSPAWREMKEKVGKVRRIKSHSGGPCKTHPRWDWGAHDVAMRIDIAGSDCPHEMHIHEDRTPRRFTVYADNGEFTYDDPPTEPRPLEVLVGEFMAAIGKGDSRGLQMGRDVERVLA